MKFECDSCHAQYMIADEKVGKRGVKVKCKRCSHVIVVRPDGAPAAKDGARESAKEARVEKAPADTAKAAPEVPVDDGLEAPPPPPPEPEVTGPSRPAPVPMAADTQLGAAAPDLTDMAPPPAPPAPALATELSMPPAAMPAAMPEPPRAPAAAAPAIKGESSIGDALDDQLAGAFNSMFDESRPALADLSRLSTPPSPEEQRGPTQILDLESMNALRRATAGAERVERDALDSLRRDLSPPAEESSGLWNDNKKPSITVGSSGKPIDDGLDLPEWHVAIDDEDVGPITLEAMGRHIAAGAVDRQSLVWKTGMGDWLPAGEVPKVKDLFSKAPLPKIAPPVDDTAARGRSRPGSFDVGNPIDDLPPAAGGSSPFDNVPGMDESDPHWQPHGLTDVYQAANLAEAASSGSLGGGLVGNAGMAARNSGPVPAASSSSSEPEWRPSASSALASLVNDEIDRLAKGPGLPPADDLGPRPADDAAIGGSLPFSSLGGMSLDAGAEMSDPSAGLGGRAATSQVPAFSSEPSFPQPSFGGPQAFAPPPAPPPPQRSPVFYAGIAGVAVVFVMLSLLTYKVVFDKPAQQVIVMGPNGVPIQPMVDANGQVIMPQPPVAAPVAAPVVAPGAVPPPAPAPAPEPVAAPPAGDPPPPPPPAAGDPPPPPPPTQVAINNTRKPPPPPPTVRTPPPPPPPPVATGGGGKKCDPVLDFDCKAGGGSSEPATAAKSTLEKSDILGVVKGSLGKVKDCGAKHGASGTIKMSWNISKAGKPTDVSVADTKYGGTPVGACVTGVVKAMKFPSYSGAAPPTVSIPLPLG